MNPSVTVDQLHFSDGSSVMLNEGGLLLIVGPNKAAKSRCLRDIYVGLDRAAQGRRVVPRVVFRLNGTRAELAAHLEQSGALVVHAHGRQRIRTVGANIDPKALFHFWSYGGGLHKIEPEELGRAPASNVLRAAGL